MSKRIQDLKSPLTIWRQKAAAILRRPYDALSPNQRFWIGFGVLSLSATLLVSNPFWRTQSAQIYSEREIARETIVSPADITVVDDEASESTRLAVMSSISPTFMYEPRRADEAVQSFRSAWEDLQRRADPPAPGRANVDAPTEVQWTGAGGPELGRVLGARQFSNNELSALERMLREHASGDVYGDSDRQYLGDEIKIIDRQRPTDIRQAMRPVFTMTSVSDARARLKESIGDLRSLSDEEKEAFYAALAPLIQPSLVYDSAATESEKLAAAQDVEPQTITLKRGQKIVGEGELITADVMAQLAALEQYGSSTRRVNRFIGLFLIVTALFWIAWKFIEHRGIVPRLALSEQMTFA
ncbi:MAG TPA: hypothetical protein VK918_01925, partial [Pyrinomonadaceae bacterium]|nr:hypothetical protein [Pyrinomonadaceae bacterium]